MWGNLISSGERDLSWFYFCAFGELIQVVLMYNQVGNTTIFPANSAGAETSELRRVSCIHALLFVLGIRTLCPDF